MNPAQRATRAVITRWGWQPGTTLEDEVAHRLHLEGHRPDEVDQQHSVGRCHLDFAWPDLHVALECDGWWHRSPEGAARDAERDADLRAAGWLVLRVDDRDPSGDALRRQVARVSEVIKALGGPPETRRTLPDAAALRALATYDEVDPMQGL